MTVNLTKILFSNLFSGICCYAVKFGTLLSAVVMPLCCKCYTNVLWMDVLCVEAS